MVLDQHVLDSLLQRPLLVSLPRRQLPVRVQVEGELRSEIVVVKVQIKEQSPFGQIGLEVLDSKTYFLRIFGDSAD